MAYDVEPRSNKGLRPAHGVATIAVAVVGVIVGFWVLESLAGILWFFLKLGIIVALVAGVLSLFMRRHR